MGKRERSLNQQFHYRARAGVLSRKPGGFGRYAGLYRVIKVERCPAGEKGAGENEGRLSHKENTATRTSLPGVFPCRQSPFLFHTRKARNS